VESLWCGARIEKRRGRKRERRRCRQNWRISSRQRRDARGNFFFFFLFYSNWTINSLSDPDLAGSMAFYEQPKISMALFVRGTICTGGDRHGR